MCEQCDDLQRRIDQFRRAVSNNYDALTTERLKAGLSEMEARKIALHPERT
jgi:hypothetical protein